MRVVCINFAGWYEINLDKRKLRTPGGSLFRVPNEALALAVATEWNAQEKLVKRHSMHLVNYHSLLFFSGGALHLLYSC